jgi:hypothetical protein
MKTTFEILSKAVETNISPHFLLFYKTYECPLEQQFKKAFSYKTYPNYDIYLLEHVDGLLEDVLISHIQHEDDFITNIITQVVMCIASLHGISKMAYLNTSEKTLQPCFVYQSVESNVYICYEIKKTKYYLKSFGYLVQLYVQNPLSKMHGEYISNFFHDYKASLLYVIKSEAIISKIREIFDIINHLETIIPQNLLLAGIDEDLSIQKNKEIAYLLDIDIYILESLISANILHLLTKDALPDDAIILNKETPYFLPISRPPPPTYEQSILN